MVITTLLLFRVERTRWRWPLWAVLGSTVFFLIIDLAFWGANLLKIPAGGWFPLVVGAGVMTLMTTWRRGRTLLAQRLRIGVQRLDEFIARLDLNQVTRVPGTAIFMYSDPERRSSSTPAEPAP